MCQCSGARQGPDTKLTRTREIIDSELDQLRRDTKVDAESARQEYLFPPPACIDRWLRQAIVDHRDLPIAYLIFDVCCTSAPAAIALWAWRCESHLVGLAYFVTTYVLYLQRFMLTLHFSEHRRLFSRKYGALNAVCPYVLSPLLGVPPGMYRLHHCWMHHGANNRWQRDASSTERYQRDNPFHFLLYWLRYTVGSWVELPFVAASSGGGPALAQCLLLEALFLVGIPAALRWQFVPALYTLMLPFFVSSLALMLGNWSQHIFLDPAKPRHSLGLTYNCVACPDNLRSYNDGYHAVHHQRPHTHWTELPTEFWDTLEQHQQAGTLVFRGIMFMEVGLAVFTRNYDYLAKHLVRYTPFLASATPDELQDYFKERLRPVYL